MTESPAECMMHANATRYLSGVGLVIVLYDHFLTFDDEFKLVWQAKRSFAKWLFICNRYLVPIVQIGVAVSMNNFTDNSLVTTTSCRRFFAFSSMFGIASVGIANVLVLLRVVNLWERDRRIACFMFLGFIISFCSTFALMIATLVKLIPGMQYIAQVHMCVSTYVVTEIRAVWASPMIFEVFVLLAVCLNAFARPRVQNCEVKLALMRDGIGFFGAITVLRIFNLLLATVVPASLILLGVSFVWAMTTLVLNRALLNILRTTAESRARGASAPEREHPSVSVSRASSLALRAYPSLDKDFAREVYELPGVGERGR